jgi:general secretion pathway protein G
MGFTLLEIMVVVAIIAALAAVVAPSLFQNVGDAKSNAARAQIQAFALALDAYRLDNQAYPTTAQGLTALRSLPTSGDLPLNWRGPYLQRTIPLDPWKRAYEYQSPGRENPSGYDLYSLGRDGKAGGEGEDSDVTSWGGSVRP